MADPHSTPRDYSSVNPKAEGITLQNFRTILLNVQCPYRNCLRVGCWQERQQPNASGIGVQCSCGRTPPEWKTWYLPQGNRVNREKYEKSPREVWAEGGDVCWFCQTHFDDLSIIGACAERQHAHGYSETRHDGPIIPICSACHPHASALKAKHARIIKAWKAKP